MLYNKSQFLFRFYTLYFTTGIYKYMKNIDKEYHDYTFFMPYGYNVTDSTDHLIVTLLIHNPKKIPICPQFV